MDGETLDCPHRHCRGYGKPFSQGYLVKNGTSYYHRLKSRPKSPV
jgi:hypothetical protein